MAPYLAASVIPCQHAPAARRKRAMSDGRLSARPVAADRTGRSRAGSTWSTGADPYETAHWALLLSRSRATRACRPSSRAADHLNGGGTIHGGALSELRRLSLFRHRAQRLAQRESGDAHRNSEFLSAGNLGRCRQPKGEVLRETRSLVFVRGLVTQAFTSAACIFRHAQEDWPHCTVISCRKARGMRSPGRRSISARALTRATRAL